MAGLRSAVRTKPPGHMWLAGRTGTAPDGRPATLDLREDRHVRVKTVGDHPSQPRPREGILPLGGTVSDEFAVRLAAWLADVAMNVQGAA
jgi:hypothetical protein